MPLFDIFFDIEVAICEKFPALSPFDIREKEAREVFLLIERLSRYNGRKKKETKGGKQVIRRPAGDNWF